VKGFIGTLTTKGRHGKYESTTEWGRELNNTGYAKG